MEKFPLCLTFDDVLLLPLESGVEPNQISASSRFSRNIPLSLPFASSPMDTVTGEGLAIAMAREGAIGVLHRNCTERKECEMVESVKSAAPSEDSATDGDGNLVVAAACSPFDKERALALERAGADAVAIDCAHAHNLNVVKAAREMKSSLDCDLVVGNIATPEAASALSFADALKVGIGAGSICTTRVVTGVGVPQLQAILDVASSSDVPVIADGGLRYSGDVAKSLAAGASCVMSGRLFAGAEESAGATVSLGGVPHKAYRGMGSLGALKEKSDRYLMVNKTVPEGVEGAVPLAGPAKDILFQLAGGLKSSMGYVGAEDLPAFQERAKFIRITGAGREESHPHDLSTFKKAPNYSP